MTILQKQIRQSSSSQNTILLALLFAIMTFLIIPDAYQQVRLFSSETAMIEDLFFYSPERCYEMMTAFGSKGRSNYLVIQLTADVVYAIITAVFLADLLIWSAPRRRRYAARFKYLIGLPALFLISNLLENMSLVRMLAKYPEKFYYLAIASSFFTFSKWVLMLACIGIIIRNTSKWLFFNYQFWRLKQKKQSVAERQ